MSNVKKPISRAKANARTNKTPLSGVSPKLQVPVHADFKAAVDLCAELTGVSVAHIGRQAYEKWLRDNRTQLEPRLKAKGLAWPSS